MELYLGLKKYLGYDVITVVIEMLRELSRDEVDPIIKTTCRSSLRVDYLEGYGRIESVRLRIPPTGIRLIYKAHTDEMMRKIMISEYHYDGLSIDFMLDQVNYNFHHLVPSSSREILEWRKLWKQEVTQMLMQLHIIGWML